MATHRVTVEAENPNHARLIADQMVAATGREPTGARRIVSVDKWGFIHEAADGHETYYHLTDNPKFKLDPDKVPEDNSVTLSRILGPERKGMYVTKDPERWVNGHGYVRPYVAEIHANPSHIQGGEYSGEGFIPSEHLDKARVHRVMPLDAYAREQYGDHGWIEEHHGTTFDTGEPIHERKFGEPHRPVFKTPYQYDGPDVRDMPKAETDRHKTRWLDYLKENRGHDDESIAHYREHTGAYRSAAVDKWGFINEATSDPPFTFIKANPKAKYGKGYHSIYTNDVLFKPDGSLKNSPTGVFQWHHKTGEILNVTVDSDHQRQGIATQMYRHAHEISANEQGVVPPKHSDDRTDQGDSWAKSLGERVPKRWHASVDRWGFIYGSVSDPKDEEWGKEVLKHLIHNKGFSLHDNPGDGPKDGYMVSTHPESEEIHDLATLRNHPEHLSDYYNNHSHHFSDPKVHMGGWVNDGEGGDGKTYLDVSTHVKDEKEAQELGRKHKQLAYYDVAKEQSIPIAKEGSMNKMADSSIMSPDEIAAAANPDAPPSSGKSKGGGGGMPGVGDLLGGGGGEAAGLEELAPLALAANKKLAYGETVAPPEVDTLREDICPVCGEHDSYNGDKCGICGFVKPPSMFMDPDTEVAQNLDLRSDEQDANAAVGENEGDLICPVCDSEFNSAEEDDAEGEPHLAPAAETLPDDPMDEARNELDPNEEPGEEDETTEENLPTEKNPQDESDPQKDQEDEEIEEAELEDEMQDQEAEEKTGYSAGDTCPACNQGVLEEKGNVDPDTAITPDPEGSPIVNADDDEDDPDQEDDSDDEEEDDDPKKKKKSFPPKKSSLLDPLFVQGVIAAHHV